MKTKALLIIVCLFMLTSQNSFAKKDCPKPPAKWKALKNKIAKKVRPKLATKLPPKKTSKNRLKKMVAALKSKIVTHDKPAPRIIRPTAYRASKNLIRLEPFITSFEKEKGIYGATLELELARATTIDEQTLRSFRETIRKVLSVQRYETYQTPGGPQTVGLQIKSALNQLSKDEIKSVNFRELMIN